MSDEMQKGIENIVPFIVLGVVIALVIGLLSMFFYVVIWGVIIGVIIWLGFLIKEYLFSGTSAKKKEGRIIEHDDRNNIK
jgi:uncharacterized membrane protein